MKKILKNIAFAAVAVLVFVLLVNIVLALLTRHNQEIEVPDLTGMPFAEAQIAAEKAGVRVEISDSVFVKNIRKGAVFSQNPKPGSLVKQGRRVFLTTNAVTIKKVRMPSLVGCSMRQAKAELKSKGLTLGRLIYINDIATNNVLAQLYRGSRVLPGTELEAGSPIDLELGLGEDCMVYVPDLSGQSYMRAIDLIQENSLNVGRMVFDRSVKSYMDTLNAVVVSQTPDTSRYSVLMGSRVSCKLKVIDN